MIWAIADRNRKIDINDKEQIITTTVVTLISGAIGAIIGTYGGALFAAKRQEKHIKELRQVAIKALKIFHRAIYCMTMTKIPMIIEAASRTRGINNVTPRAAIP